MVDIVKLKMINSKHNSIYISLILICMFFCAASPSDFNAETHSDAISHHELTVSTVFSNNLSYMAVKGLFKGIEKVKFAHAAYIADNIILQHIFAHVLYIPKSDYCRQNSSITFNVSYIHNQDGEKEDSVI